MRGKLGRVDEVAGDGEMSDLVHLGGCLCGSIRYRIDSEIRPVIACHCVQCRIGSGHFFAATACEKSALVIDGDVRWYALSDHARRGFCPTCGAFLFWQRTTGKQISIAAGTLDPPSSLKLVAHIYIEEKGDYYEIDDGVPQHRGFQGLDRPPLNE